MGLRGVRRNARAATAGQRVRRLPQHLALPLLLHPLLPTDPPLHPYLAGRLYGRRPRHPAPPLHRLLRLAPPLHPSRHPPLRHPQAVSPSFHLRTGLFVLCPPDACGESTTRAQCAMRTRRACGTSMTWSGRCNPPATATDCIECICSSRSACSAPCTWVCAPAALWSCTDYASVRPAPSLHSCGLQMHERWGRVCREQRRGCSRAESSAALFL